MVGAPVSASAAAALAEASSSFVALMEDIVLVKEKKSIKLMFLVKF